MNGLNELISKYGSHGFEVIAMPSNSFNQNPSSVFYSIDKDMVLRGLKYVHPGNGYVPAFPLLAPADVNGANRDPLFAYLTCTCPHPGDVIFASVGQPWQLYSPVRASDISWNFAKFLVGKDGKPVKRYSPDTLPSAIAADIEALLG